MSRFVKKLQHLRETESQPFGFAPARPEPQKSRLQLIAGIGSGKLEKAAAVLKSLDAVVLEVNSAKDLQAVEKLCKSEDEIPAGGWLRLTESELLPQVMDSACDFVIFPPTAQLTVTQKDKIGRLLQLEESLTEGLLRTINDLPVDAVLISDKGKEGPLTLNRLMVIRRVISMLTKPVIVAVSADITLPELQALWDAGVSGVIVESVTAESAAELEELRNNLGKLTAPARKKDKVSPFLPHLQPEAHGHHEEEQDEEEEDDE